MGKKNDRNRKNKPVEDEDFGSVELHCSSCGHDFDMPWIDIFDFQECTHGYVGFHLNDVFISCPKCDEIINTDY